MRSAQARPGRPSARARRAPQVCFEAVAKGSADGADDLLAETLSTEEGANGQGLQVAGAALALAGSPALGTDASCPSCYGATRGVRAFR